MGDAYEVRPVGTVVSPVTEVEDAPLQGDEGAPDAWIELAPEVAAAAADLRAGDELLVLTWLHRGRRDVQVTHPRDDRTRPATGVFSTRSPDRPNPIGLHRVRVIDVERGRLLVAGLEAVDGTPVVDLKPVLGPADER